MSSSYTNIFGGGTITAAYPSYVSYSLSVSTPSIQLVWPTEFVSSAYYVSNIVEVTASTTGCSLVMPPANIVSVGQASLFTNTGGNTITLYAEDGTTAITTFSPATSTYVYLIDNSTTNGSYRVVPWATGTPSVINVAAVSTSADLVITGSPITSAGTFTFSLADDLLAITGLSTTGIVVRTGSGTWTTRTITGTANQITVTNGTGVSGNPTISLPSAVSGIASITASNIEIGVDGTNIISTADSNPLTIDAPLYLTSISGTQSPLRWYDANDSNYVAFQAPSVVPSNVTWTLPSADGTASQVLTTDGAGNLSWSSAGAGTVNSVTGTLNRITSTGGTNPIIDISASYVGQSSITTLGTIGTGVWQGTPVVVSYGGTGITTTTAYGLITGGTLSTGPFQNAGTGTATQVYVSGGSGALGTWTDQTSIGVWKLIDETTVSGQAQMAVTGLGAVDYTAFYIVIGAVADTPGGDLYMQTSSDNGSTWDTGAEYSYIMQTTPASTGVTATSNGITQNHILLATDLVTLNADMHSHSFTDAAGYNFSIWGQGVQAKSAGMTQNLNTMMGYNNVSININALRLIMSAGTISGYMAVYGSLPTA